MQLTNYHNTPLQLSVTRSIDILNDDEINSNTGLSLDTSVKVVGLSNNKYINQYGQRCMD